MKKKSQAAFYLAAVLVIASFVHGETPQGTMAFTVSMERPDTHYYHVEFKCEGLKGETLDFKIRVETQNRRSLDDVMRALYQEYYKEKKRGFTDGEFRAVCERIAGCPLAEIFDVYVSTTEDIDYPKYLAYAGLEIDVQLQESAGPYSGISTRERDGKLIISNVEWDSPAMKACLSAEDEIIALDGVRINARTMSELLLQKKPADVVRVLISRRGTVREAEVILGKRQDRRFAIKPVADPTPLQAEILRSWLGE